jgi:hypothetical protein
MGYRIDGVVTFEFSGVVTASLDPLEARHEVETMSLGELFDYADDVAVVEVTRQEVIR